MLEAALTEPNNCFVTLTYADEHLPQNSNSLPTLNRRDFTLWLKRLRKEIAPLRLRYYGVGEYSPLPAERPHYHAVVFGLQPCSSGQTITDYRGMPEPRRCCPTCKLIAKTWVKYGKEGTEPASLGLIYVGQVTRESAAYVAGYIEKKMTRADDVRLRDRDPEFASMSGGLGRDFMWEIASDWLRYDLDEKYQDVPGALRHGKKIMPLGRYLRGKLREMVGKDAKAPQATLDQIKEELRPMRESAFNNSRSFKDEVVKSGNQAVLNMEARRAIFKSKKDRLK